MCVVLILLARFIGTGKESSADLLAYASEYYGWQTNLLKLYDPDNRMSVPVATGTIGKFTFSADGRLVYSLNENDNDEIYLLDTHTANPQAINITQMPISHEFPLEWSPDGRYLAFVSNQDEKSLIYVWDGETTFNITPELMPDIAESYTTDWSYDGRLAITVSFGYSAQDLPSEIYLWDGLTTTNLSQNPNGADYWPVWSLDGRVAYFSDKEKEYDIFIWDGVSLKDNSPDVKTIIDDPSVHIGYSTYPSWTPDGYLAFTSQIAPDTETQIYFWDGQTATNIREYPGQNNIIPNWGNSGRWPFMTNYLSRQFVICA